MQKEMDYSQRLSFRTKAHSKQYSNSNNIQKTIRVKMAVFKTCCGYAPLENGVRAIGLIELIVGIRNLFGSGLNGGGIDIATAVLMICAGLLIIAVYQVIFFVSFVCLFISENYLLLF